MGSLTSKMESITEECLPEDPAAAALWTRYRELAVAHYQDCGRIEIDLLSPLSVAPEEDEEAEGVYVPAWVYVPKDWVEAMQAEEAKEAAEASAQQSLFLEREEA